MIHHAPHISLPPLPQFSLSALPPTSSLTATATISESSTRLSDLSTLPSGTPFATFTSDVTSAREFSKPMPELLPPGPFTDHPGYIPILPRTSSAAGMFKKQCETCCTTHDGSFGAGRFCSSRCARTVGGLAHRKKRMLERGAKARHAAESRAKIKKARLSRIGSDSSIMQGRSLAFDKLHVDTSPVESPRSVMTIGALLNPTE